MYLAILVLVGGRTVCARKGTEIVIKRPVLFDYNNNMFDGIGRLRRCLSCPRTKDGSYGNEHKQRREDTKHPSFVWYPIPPPEGIFLFLLLKHSHPFQIMADCLTTCD